MNKVKGIIFSIALVLVIVCCVGCQSAYDIAVKNGFDGTEAQWLESLKGKNGADGADLNIKDIFEEAQNNGFEGGYLEFLHEYLNFTTAPDNTAAISKGLQSAVLVYCNFTRASGGIFSTSNFAQTGAGVIYKINKEQGTAYIITNYHVVYSSESNTSNKVSSSISVTPYGGEQINVTYIGGVARYDIAVLKAENSYFTTDLPRAVSVVSSDDISVGQTVIAIGNPAGQGISATQGIISVDSENITMSSIENESTYTSIRVMRMDAAVNSGNSGGGLFDANGDLVGIVNAKSADDSIENMAYAIPASVASAVADNIIKNTVFTKGTVGITLRTQNSKAYLDNDGLIKISETVIVNSADGAAKNILKSNDIILSITLDKEITVTREFHVTDALLRSSPGDTVTFKILRSGKELTVEVVCG